MRSNSNVPLRIGHQAAPRSPSASSNVSWSPEVPICAYGDISWSQWNVSDLLDGCPRKLIILEWEKNQVEAQRFVDAWNQRQAATCAGPTLGVALFDPLCPDKFAEKTEILESIGFMSPISNSTHTTFAAFAQLLRTEDWTVLRGHYRKRRHDRNALKCARVLAGWEAFMELAVHNMWGVDTSSEGGFVAGECLGRLEEATIKTIRRLPSQCLARTFNCFKAVSTAFPGLAFNMPKLVDALTTRWPDIAATVPSPIFANQTTPGAHVCEPAPAAAAAISKAAFEGPDLDGIVSFVLDNDADMKPGYVGSSGDSPVSALHQGGLSSGNTSPAVNSGDDAEVQSQSDIESEASEDCGSDKTFSTYTSATALLVRQKLEDCEAFSVRELYGWLIDDRYDSVEKWVDLKEVFEYEAEQASQVPRDKRICEPEHYLAEIDDMEVWLLRWDLVLGNPLRVEDWPKGRRDAADEIRDYYGLPCYGSEETESAEDRSTRGFMMQLNYATLFDNEFKAPEGIEPWAVAESATEAGDEKEEGDDECCDDSESDAVSYTAAGDRAGAFAGEIDEFAATQTCSDTPECAQGCIATNSISSQERVETLKTSSWWRKVVEAVKQGGSRVAAVVAAGTKAACTAVAASVRSAISICGFKGCSSDTVARFIR